MVSVDSSRIWALNALEWAVSERLNSHSNCGGEAREMGKDADPFTNLRGVLLPQFGQ